MQYQEMNSSFVSSPSQVSLFSVSSVSSQSSGVSETQQQRSLPLGKKLKNVLTRNNNANSEDWNQGTDSLNSFSSPSTSKLYGKNKISNPVPISDIPVRRGTVDLKFNIPVYLENSLENCNTLFHNNADSRNSDDADFYFTEVAPPLEKTPFDYILRDTGYLLSKQEHTGSFQRQQDYYDIDDSSKRFSTASTVTPLNLNKKSSYRSSRITLNKLKIQPAVTSPTLTLFSPVKSLFNQSHQPPMVGANSKKVRRNTIHRKSGFVNYHYKTNSLSQGETLESYKTANGDDIYDEMDTFLYEQMAYQILNSVEKNPFFHNAGVAEKIWV